MKALLLCLAFFVVLCLRPAFAGPPFLTDDPEPVPYHHWEAYVFTSGDRTRSSDAVAGPALEINNGAAPNTQLHLVVPEAYSSQDGQSARGLGDSEIGVKYRFVEEKKNVPEVGIFPMIELATGDQSRGLGNGRTWAKLPVWIQKTAGAWTSYGGGGYAYNPAPGQRDYFYGGVLLQRELTPRLSLGGELFFQGAQADQPSGGAPVPGARSSEIWNAGGFYNFTPDFSLLFSAGHSFQGDGSAIYYLGLYRTWGPGSP